MVDLLGMFRRRPAKRNAPGFARTRADITALGDTMGEMLTSPVRDAPRTTSTTTRWPADALTGALTAALSLPSFTDTLHLTNGENKRRNRLIEIPRVHLSEYTTED